MNRVDFLECFAANIVSCTTLETLGLWMGSPKHVVSQSWWCSNASLHAEKEKKEEEENKKTNNKQQQKTQKKNRTTYVSIVYYYYHTINSLKLSSTLLIWTRIVVQRDVAFSPYPGIRMGESLASIVDIYINFH